MRTIKIPSTSLAQALALALLVVASAQAQGAASRAEKMEWPRTFSGQPDFMFTRDEAVAEARAKAARENTPLPLLPGLQQLVADDTALDPLMITRPVLSVSDTADVSGTEDISGTLSAPLSRQSLMDKLMAQSVDLPAVAATGEPDLSEFKAELEATITRTVAGWKPDAARYSFGSALNALVLQAIVTSPVSYAVINQQRYEVGDTFRVSVPMPVPDAEIIAALQAQLPAPGALTPALEESYRKVYEGVLADFNVRRGKTPDMAQQVLDLPVKVIGIARREVQLELNGQPYTLAIRYAY